MHGILTAQLLQECFGVGPGVPVTVPAAPIDIDPARYTGRFTADDGEVTLAIENGRLRLVPASAPGLLQSFYLMGFPPPAPDYLIPVAADGRFVSDRGTPVSFIDDGAGRPKYVYVGRIYRPTGA